MSNWMDGSFTHVVVVVVVVVEVDAAWLEDALTRGSMK